MFDAEVITKSFGNIGEEGFRVSLPLSEANAALECQRNGDFFK